MASHLSSRVWCGCSVNHLFSTEMAWFFGIGYSLGLSGSNWCWTSTQSSPFYAHWLLGKCIWGSTYVCICISCNVCRIGALQWNFVPTGVILLFLGQNQALPFAKKPIFSPGPIMAWFQVGRWAPIQLLLLRVHWDYSKAVFLM